MKRKIVAFGLAVFGLASIGISQLPVKAVDTTRDCDQYAVIRCGTLNENELRAEYNTNNGSSQNEYTTVQPDIQRVFSSMGIQGGELNGLVAGTVYRDGTVKVNGNTVATGAVMAARGLGGTQIPNTSAQRVSVSAMASAQAALVKMVNGEFKFAIMTPCGNPVTATPVPPEPKPKAECKNLKEEKISDTRRRYEAVALLENGATVNSYTFVATRNGKQIDSVNKQAATYTLDATEPGNYTVRVTIHTSEGPRTGEQCAKSFSVTPPTPDQPGVAIEKYVNTNQKYQRVGVNVEYSYLIKVTNTGDVALKNVKVSDTPDRAISLIRVSPSVGSISNNTWTYTIPSLAIGQTLSYTITAKVPVYLAGKLVNTVCVDAPEVPGNPDDCDDAEVDVPPAPGKIEVCELATKKVITINEADFDSSKHTKDLNQCKVPELPQTGPVEAIMQIIGAMSLVGSAAYYISSRRIA